MIRVIIIITAVYLGIDNSLSIGLGGGYDIGADLCGNKYINHGISHGTTPYGNLAEIQIYINWCLLFFIAGVSIKTFVAGKSMIKEFLSQIISLPAIGLVFWEFIRLYNLKNSYVADEDKYFDLMRFTLQADYVYIWAAFALLIYQLITAVQLYFDWKSKRLKVS